MKNAKWWMQVWAAIALAAGLAVPTAHGQAYGLTEVVGGVTWTYSVEADFTATITGANPAEGNLTIPSTFSGGWYHVTRLGEYGYMNWVRTSYPITEPVTVAIPASVTNITDGVFANCYGLTQITVDAGNTYYESQDGVLFTKSVDSLVCFPSGKEGAYTIPSTVTNIEIMAFSGCNGLTSVTIPAGVTHIEDNTFAGCFGLTQINVAPGNKQYLGQNGVLFNKSGSKLLRCPIAKTGAYEIPSTVTDVVASAFLNCSGLTSVTIPSSVTSIGVWAFSTCQGLTNVTIPASVSSIENSAFWNCRGLTSVTLPSSVTSIGDSAFGACVQLPAVTIPAGVTNIGIGAFANCQSLATFTLAAGNGHYAVKDGVLLTKSGDRLVCCPGGKTGEYTIPSSVTRIEDQAFAGCSGLTKVTIPANVASIGRNAFESCSESIYDTATVAGVRLVDGWAIGPTEYGYFLSGAVDLTGVRGIADGAFSWCYGMTSVTIPTGVTSIGAEAFSGCGLTTVAIPASVTSIGDGAFSSCYGLTSVTMPSGVTSIGNDAFSGCSGLPTVTIPASVTNIGNGAFSGCGGLTSVTIPASVTSIGNDAFSGCSGLPTVTIPASVTNIGYGAFSGCGGLTSVTIPASVASIGNRAFGNCFGLTQINVASGNKRYLGKDGVLFNKSGDELLCCPGGKTGVYAIPSGVTNIGYEAFAYCRGLTSVTIPSGVVGIGDGAFQGCEGLVSVAIPDSVARIGLDAFNDTYLYDTWSLAGVCLVDGWAMRPEAYESFPGALVLTGVRGIAEQSFMYCSGLTSVTIPESARHIGAWAFSYCNDLTTVRILSSEASIGEDVFEACPALKTLYAPGTWKSKHVDGKLWSVHAGVPAGCSIVYDSSEAQLELAASERSFTSTAASGQQLGVTANVAWTAKSSATWLTLQTAGGSGNGTILYDVAVNAGASSRSGTITVSGGGIERTFTVTQGGFVAMLELDAAERTFTAAAAGSQQLGVTATVAWTAKSSATWLAVQTTNGSGSGTILYDVAENGATEARTGTITVEGSGITRTFTVTQGAAASALVLSAGSQSFTADGAIGQKLGVTANVAWTAESDAAWLTLKAASGSGNGSILYDVAAYGGEDERTGTITVSGGGLTRTFTVTQSGPVAWSYEIAGGKATVKGANPAEGALAIPSSLGGCPVEGIGRMAFWTCPGLTAVTIASGVESVGECAFYGCAGLASVTIPDSVTSVGGGAFDGCSASLYDTASVAGVRLVDGWAVGTTVSPSGALDLAGVRGIAGYAFYGCSGLTAVAMPDGVAGIGDYAFHGCSGLSELRIPDSVATIGAQAFLNCVGLQTLYVPARFEGTDMLANAGVPAGCRVVYCENELSLASDGRSFTAAAATGQELGVTANVAWTAESDAAWLTVNTASGSGNGTITYDVAANAGTSDRTGTITVTGGGLAGTFTVTQKGADPLPEATDASQIAEVLDGAADERLKEKIATVEEYNGFRAWALRVKGNDGTPAGAEAVLASEHAWPSWLLGAETLFGNEPEIRIAGVAAGVGLARASSRDAASGTLAVRVRVTDGGKVATVDAEKVKALFRATSDVRNWERSEEVECAIEADGTKSDGTLSFTVRVQDGGAGRAFLGLRE